MNKAGFLKFLRLSHGWLGIFVLPWIIMIGATGFYLNHSKFVLSLIPSQSYDESLFDLWEPEQEVTRETARALAETVWPDEPIEKVERGDYHNRPAYTFIKDSGRIIVTQPSGHYFVKTRYVRRTFAPDGELLHKKVYWKTLFGTLHVRGWTSRRFGTWLADITSISMILFGFSGIFMWWMPRSKKFLRKLKRLKN